MVHSITKLNSHLPFTYKTMQMDTELCRNYIITKISNDPTLDFFEFTKCLKMCCAVAELQGQGK